MAKKEYSTLSKSIELQPHHPLQINNISRTPFFVGGEVFYSSAGDIVNVNPADKANLFFTNTEKYFL